MKNSQTKRVNVTQSLAKAGYHLRTLRGVAERQNLSWYVARATAALDELNAARTQLERDRRALDAVTKRIDRKVNHIEKQSRQLQARLTRKPK